LSSTPRSTPRNVKWSCKTPLSKGNLISVLWLFKIVIWRPMFCHTNTEISKRNVTPWPCNNFAGQCILQ
jgi:hypothetical protein